MKETILHFAVSNKPHPGLDNLLKSTEHRVRTQILGMGSKTLIGHHENAAFGLKLELMKQELQKCDPSQIVMHTDGWDVLFQDSVDKFIVWVQQHPGKVLFAAELGKWPDEDLAYPEPLQTPFPFLNSGCYCGRARDILKLLQKPFDFRTNDQRYFSHQFADPANTIIELDHKAELFLCMYNLDEKDVHFHEGHITFQGKRPVVLHLNNKLTREKWESRVLHALFDKKKPQQKKPSQTFFSDKILLVLLAILFVMLCLKVCRTR